MLNRYKNLWDSEIEKKLFRCSKELGVYNVIKKTCSKPKLIKEIKQKTFAALKDNEDKVLSFTHMASNLSYPTLTAIEDERHFCHLLGYEIIICSTYITKDTMNKLFNDFSKEVFKKHKIHNKYLRFKGNIKMFFK